MRRARAWIGHDEPAAQAVVAAGSFGQRHLSRCFKAAFGMTQGHHAAQRRA
jgi:methylphosphotriester-DNA--protein-cysteine methyltransferase